MQRSEDTQRRIIEAAYFLFYRHGFARVSLDMVAQRAKLTKRTVYLHFRSKDDLLAAALERYSELDAQRLRVIEEQMQAETPEVMIEALFRQFTDWASKPRFSGAGFTRVVVELGDLPGHPARAVARRAKVSIENWLTDLLTRHRVAAPSQRAREIMLLLEGVNVMMLVHGDRDYGETAARAARRLLSQP
jgi:AcrR family transcriptional regulator